MKPKVSIITTTFQNPKSLKRIIKQVKLQDYPHLEYIIINGGSDPETSSVIREAEKYFGDQLLVIEEPDTGIYNALNKGILVSTGEIIGCLFDEYASADSLSKLVDLMVREKTDGVHADLLYVQDGRTIRKWKQGKGNIRSGWLPGHPTLYLKREVYETYGLYREDYRIAADYEFMVRCFKDGRVKLSYLPEIVIYMEYGGTSNKSLKAYLTSLKEGHRALKENGIPFAFVTDFLRMMRVILQFRVPVHDTDKTQSYGRRKDRLW